MGSIVDFDAPALEGLLEEHGLRRTWLSILKTALRGREDLAYIFGGPEFAGAVFLDADLIAGLSVCEISVLYEYSRTVEDPAARKSNGQFFTPDDVADFMAGFAARFPDGRWLDPCSGIGNLSWHLVAKQGNPEEFLRTRMLLSDKDELALLIARTLLTSTFQRDRAELFYEIEPNFIVFDFLSVADDGRETLFGPGGGLDLIPAHDFVIVNPPYLATKQVDGRFEAARSADLFAYFLENVIKTSRGFISVTPQSFTNAGKFAELRALLLENYSDLTILCFDNMPAHIFRGIKFGSRNTNTVNSTRAAITVALPGDGRRRIGPLTRWRAAERGRLFAEVEGFVSDVPLQVDYFPKVSTVFQGLYERLRGGPVLASICRDRPTEFPLFVPSAPRYFISALKVGVRRASLQVIYFGSAADRDRAYIVLNSSLMYWWWRVRDGGMTVSRETLLSLPLPGFEVDPGLVAALEESESANKVFKVNAGAVQENVKHPTGLIMRLNEVVAADYAERLIANHGNSEFVLSGFLSGAVR